MAVVSVAYQASEAKPKAPMANAIPPSEVTTAPTVAHTAPRDRAIMQTTSDRATPRTPNARPSMTMPVHIPSRSGAMSP